MTRIILCIDMDAFFASVEQQANPTLRGKPVAVIGSGARTVVVTRSYEARRFGVKTGMTVYEAKRLCPQLIFVVGDNEKYTYTCAELEQIYRRFTPDIEIYSIDEAFLDVTTTHHLFGGPEAIGAAIKQAIRTRFGITATVGIAPNILIAKLASDLAKPDGLRWVRPEAVAALLEDLPVRELWGIGPAITAKLAGLGIKTCGQLGRAPEGLLRAHFGIVGESLKAMGNGLCRRPLASGDEEPKSIGHSMTLRKDTGDKREIEAFLLQLSGMVGRRARRHGYLGGDVTLTLRYADFETFTRQGSLPGRTNSTHDIYTTALGLLRRVRLRDKVRLLGVTLGGLVRDEHQLLIFEGERKRRNLLAAMDEINDRHGDFTIVHAAYLKQLDEPDVISPAWRPSGVRNVPVK